MATHTAFFGFLAPSPRSTPQQAWRGKVAAQPTPGPVALPAPATPWLERLADWADRQPAHHRLGSWTRA